MPVRYTAQVATPSVMPPYGDAVEVASQAVERPFYLLKEVKISEFSGGTHTFTIGYNDINDLIHNELYDPGFSVHYTVSSGKYEYNNRLHRYDVTTRLYEGREIVCAERTRTVRRIEYVRQDLCGHRVAYRGDVGL